MWLLVMFDLPVTSKKQQKAATAFRNHLLDEGFQMAQFSVYMRFTYGKENADAYCKRVRQALPRWGKVSILTITDKQYERMICFYGGEVEQAKKNPEQLVLF